MISFICIANVLFKGFTKLLVANGGNLGIINTVEVIDLSSDFQTCNDLPNFPYGATAQTGILYNQTTPTICGGWNDDMGYFSSDCYSLTNNVWTKVILIDIKI